ncbi:hypothetical protein N7470_010284 [Penicillium chermesinum]|nr:hypothetical protein N7470_010284 [Penicillium chermesinum]
MKGSISPSGAGHPEGLALRKDPPPFFSTHFFTLSFLENFPPPPPLELIGDPPNNYHVTKLLRLPPSLQELLSWLFRLSLDPPRHGLDAWGVDLRLVWAPAIIRPPTFSRHERFNGRDSRS